MISYIGYNNIITIICKALIGPGDNTGLGQLWPVTARRVGKSGTPVH